jgi:hypothetical protein
MKKNIYLAGLAICLFSGIAQAEESEVNIPQCKKCSLRPRSNDQPNQYEYYEDYLKVQETKGETQKS